MERDQLWKILESIQAQIRAFDTKAQIVIGINGVMAGFVLTSTQKVSETTADITVGWVGVVSLIFSLCALAAAACSLFFAIYTIVARFKENQPRSLTFFGHIADAFGEDYETCARTYSQMTDEQFSNQVSYQILTNSGICAKKAGSFKPALRLMALGIFFWFVSIPFTLAAESHIKPPQVKSASPCAEYNFYYNNRQ